MLPGHHLRLALVSLFFLLGRYNAAPPLIARSIIYTNEGKNLTEELKNVENSNNVYPSSHHHSVPVNTDVNSSERSAPKALSANSSTVSIWNNNTFNGYITSHVYSTSSNGRVLSLVSPYPDSSGMLPSRSANRMNFVSVNSNYKPHRLSPVDTGRIEGPDNLNQHQYKGHVTDGTPLHHHQTDEDQRGGRTRDLFKRTIKINENISIVRGIGQHIIPTQNVSSTELKLVLSNSSEHLNIMNLSSKFVHQHHLQMAQRPYIQESWKPYTDPVQAIKGPQSVSFRSKQGEQTSSERDTTRSGDQTVNYKATNIIRVKTSHAFKGYHSLMTTKTNSQDHIQDISRRSQLGPFATHLPTPNSVTSNGLFSSQRLPSAGINRVQAQHSQRKPSATIYATPAPQLVWRSPYRLKSEGDDAKFLDSPPMTLSPSNYISHPNFRRFGGLQTISATSRTGTVQWLVIKPKPAHAARDFTMKSSKDLYHPQTLHDQQAREYGEPKDKMALIGIQAGQDQSKRSHGWTANANVSVSNAEVPSIGRLVEHVYDFDHSKRTMKNYLSIKSSQISKTIASDAGKTPSQDLSAASKGDARSTSMYSQVNASPNRDATGGDQAVDGLWNIYSQFGSVQNHLSNVFASDTEMQYSKPAQTRMFSSKISPERVLTIKGAYSSDGNIHSAHESTSHSGTLSHSYRPQNATEDKGSDSFLEFFSASPEPVTPRNEIRHIQEKINIHEVKSAEEHQMENVEHAKTVQQYTSLFNIKHSSSPTSSVVILKRNKVHPTDKRKDSETQYRSENARSQPLIYRSPIIRKKSKSKPLNGLVDPSEDFATSENHGRLNQNIEIGAQTENLPAKFEVEPSYATGILRNANVPAQTTGTHPCCRFLTPPFIPPSFSSPCLHSLTHREAVGEFCAMCLWVLRQALQEKENLEAPE
ncbi:hypothetical protein SRHO_G00026540 [Serrasalmus rhombeus]